MLELLHRQSRVQPLLRRVRRRARLVLGLTDNTQYAVVLDSPGQVVAIVTELNLLAGDNAMIYKAFLAP